MAIPSSSVYDLPVNEHAVVSTTVAASVEECFAVGVDLEAYPEWADGITGVTVEQRDESGRPILARFEASALGRRASYVLAYDLTGAPGRLGWSLVDGDVTRQLEGSYQFESVDSDESGSPVTKVTYELQVDLAVPLPGFVKRRAEDKIVSSALERFSKRVTAQA